ncbi:MAG: oxidoreductase [Rhodospirillales bacterium]|nr:MAG: oxidoreductase [Rhodospirillales bacterium]
MMEKCCGIDLVPPATPRVVGCRVVALGSATHDIRIVRLKPISQEPLAFAAGQYARLAFGDLPSRDYSMASPPWDPVLEFHIRHMDGGGASDYVARTLRIGDPVWLEGPFGDAWLRPEHPGPILAVAGGSGLGPIRAIVDTALACGVERPVQVYLGVRDERDVYLEGHFMALQRRHPNLRFEAVLSDPQGATRRRTGPLDRIIAADLAGFGGFKAYLAGPPAMVEAVVETLVHRGLPAGDIHADPFYPDAKSPTVPRPVNPLAAAFAR